MDTTAWVFLIVGLLVGVVVLYLVVRTAVIHAIEATRPEVAKQQSGN